MTQETLPPTLAAPSPHDIRQMLEDAVVRDLRGPAGGDTEEVAESRVSDRYIVGVLAPGGTRILAEEQDTLADAESASGEDGAEEAPPASEGLMPTSLGLTFTVAGDAAAILVTASWGRYQRVRSETVVNPDTGNPKLVWKREPMGGQPRRIELVEGTVAPLVADEREPGVYITGKVRRRDDAWTVTLFLVNGQARTESNKDAVWLFQAELAVACEAGQAIFIKRAMPRAEATLDPARVAEEAALAMLYRDHLEFAVGHGTAVQAELAPDGHQRAIRLATRAMPAHEVPRNDPASAADFPLLAGLVRDMKQLGEADPALLQAMLEPIAGAYEAWIQTRQNAVNDGDDGLAGHTGSAGETLGRCREALGRIRSGIALLVPGSPAARAFQFANQAMHQQRIRSILAERRRRGAAVSESDVDIPENRTWHPFQLAFILLNLPSVTDLHHPDRSDPARAIADLLWFPTGGGKTEAYLGLAAYTLGLRRLQGIVGGRSGEAGVSVLMRYTLRLLTIQQFQRAAALICACERIRQVAEETWGKEPFRIGLWVGMKTTPNTTDQAADAIRQGRGDFKQSNVIGGSGTPYQLTFCPWCGTRIDEKRHLVVRTYQTGEGRTLMFCGDEMGNCPFSEARSPSEGIPAIVVDEEIYRRLPSLLIGTVDKFAQLPWKGETQMLFGQVDGRCERHGFRSPEIEDSDSHPAKKGALEAARTVPTPLLRPPDLIIQDELHLISGPLGTLVGLFETAVDCLCSWKVDGQVVRPKVVASSATIRQAQEQVHDLFSRRVAVFPPHGTEVGCNFFSIQRNPGPEHPGRRYIGICAPGRRLKAVLIRVYVAFLAAAQQLYLRYGAAADPWMTLVGYFNAMQELGGMRRLVDDDVRSRLRKADERGLARRGMPRVEELTSRKSADDIPLILDRLERGFDPAEDLRREEARKRGAKSEGVPPLDVLLATNMISVGVDVRRLGLMVVSGQPKGTAEYIQATSRVGRAHPGLVCTVYNWARPRDLSHYERFEHYHATFYQHVEALSVTPFAPRALDRGLTAILVALTRLAGMQFNPNGAARHVDPADGLVREAIAAILARAETVGSRAIANEVERALRHRLDVWQHEARPGQGRLLGYERTRDGQTVNLLLRPGESRLGGPGRAGWQLFTCPTSMRDVEPEVDLILDDSPLEEGLGSRIEAGVTP